MACSPSICRAIDGWPTLPLDSGNVGVGKLWVPRIGTLKLCIRARLQPCRYACLCSVCHPEATLVAEGPAVRLSLP